MPFKASQLVEAGFSREAINKMIDRQRPVFKSAGFIEVSSWRANANNDWAGTLVISAS